MSAAETVGCRRSIQYAEAFVHCTLPPDHTGYHVDDDGIPFGPWIERVVSSPGHGEAGGGPA